MKTIALVAQKGGAGKTTLALSLAVAAEMAGATSVIIDLDPQATACKWGDRRQADTPVIVDAQPARLQNALEKAQEAGVDLAIIDTPPRSEQATMAAAKAADLVVIPCRPQIYDLETIPNAKELIALAGGPPILVVLNAVPFRGTRHEQAANAVEGFGLTVCPHTLGLRAAFGDSAALGQTALEYEPSGKAALETRQVYECISRLIDDSPSRKLDNEQKARSRKRAG
jgi:chromosome partitioning protein